MAQGAAGTDSMLPRLRFFIVTLAMMLLLAGAAFNFIGHSPRASGLSIGMRSAMGSPLDLALGENMAWQDRRQVLAAALRLDELARLRDLPEPTIQSPPEQLIPAAPYEQVTATPDAHAMHADLPSASGAPAAINDLPAEKVETPAPSNQPAAGRAEQVMGNPPSYAQDTPASSAPAVPIVQADRQAQALMPSVQPAIPAEPPVTKVEPEPPAEAPVMEPEPVGRAELPVKQQESASVAPTKIDKASAATDTPSPASVVNDSIATPMAEMASRAIAASSPPDISGAEETAFHSMTGAEDLISAPPTIAPAALRNTAPNERHANPEPSEQARPAAEDAAGIAPSSPSPLPNIIVEDVQAAPAIAPAPRKASRKRAGARRTATRGRRHAPPPAAGAVAPFSLPTFSFSASPPQRPGRRPARPSARTKSPAPSFYAGPGAIPLSQ